MRAIKRSGVWHFWQTVSSPKTLRKSSDHRTYFEVFLGLSCSGSGAATGVGTTSLREALCDASTPKYLTVWRRGGEIARTLETIEGVVSARVHLVLPEPDP